LAHHHQPTDTPRPGRPAARGRGADRTRAQPWRQQRVLLLFLSAERRRRDVAGVQGD